MAAFRALVAGLSEDRVGDVIRSTAFDRTCAEWSTRRHDIPLTDEHGGEPIGFVDATTLDINREGLVVNGHIDTDSDQGMRAWRQLKAGEAGFSIAFKAALLPREGGRGRVIDDADLTAVCVTTRPTHPATRLLPRLAPHDDQRTRAENIEREFAPLLFMGYAC
jgi:HK97 family phage prohead protease